MKVVSNYQWRNLKYGYEMPQELRSDFDYIPADEFDYRDFVEYKGAWYDVQEIMRAPEDMPKWDGVVSQSYFHAVLFKFSRDGEQVICGMCFS